MQFSGATQTVANLEESRKFYEEILGFKPGAFYAPTRWQSYECQDDVFFAIGEAPGSTDEISFGVADVEDLWLRVKEHVTIVRPLEKTDWGTYRFVIRDPDGHLLAFGQKPSATKLGEGKLSETELETAIDIQRLGYELLDKPVIVGGLAMEYYGLRKHGDDVDFIVTERDYQGLKLKFPNHRKDVWGDFGFLVHGFELFRSIYKFDHAHYSLGAIEMTNYKIINIDMLFRMKVFAMGVAEKHDRDLQLLKEYYQRFQNPEYLGYMNRHIERYTSSETGIFVGVEYEDET